LKKNNIAFLIPSLESGGAERVVSTLSNSLVSDFNVTLIILYNCKIFYTLNPNIKLEFCKEDYNPNQNILQGIINHFKLLKQLKKIIKKNEIKIIIGFMTTANVYAVIISKLLRMPSIISERVHPKYIMASKFWFFLRRLTYPLTDCLVVQTNEILEYFSKFVKQNKIKIILNPLSPELASKRFLSSKREKVILNVGRLDYQKNQDLLIKAFSKIQAKNWRLYLLGDGNRRGEYENLIENLNMGNSIFLKGNVSNVEEYYNTSSIFVFTSRFEGFPNALTEAMYFGLPSISTNCPSGPAEIINDSKNGFLIPVGDQKSLESKLSILINNSELREKFSKESILSTTDFDVIDITTNWKNLINDLI